MIIGKVKVRGILLCLLAVSAITACAVTLSRAEQTGEKKPDDAREEVFRYGYAKMLQKDYDASLKAFEKVVNEGKDHPRRERAIMKLAEIYEIKDMPVEAREYYNLFIKENPSSPLVPQFRKKAEALNMKILTSKDVEDQDYVTYEVMTGDSLGGIAKQYKTTIELIKKVNKLDSNIITPGQKLKVWNAKLSITVSKSQNILHLKNGDEIFKTYTVATGKNNSTPVGTFVIEEKLVSPPWYKMDKIVTADDDNYELGTRWLGLSKEGYGIHGTKHEDTIGNQVTKGCVRMKNKDVEELFDLVPVGTEVTIAD